MELESAMTAVVRNLEEAGIADDTVIVLVGDHYPYGLGNGKTWHNDRDYIDDLMKTDDALYWNEDKNGLIIWSGCLEHDLKDMTCEISEPVSSLDILPTVSNLFGVEFDSRLLPGRDVFAPDTMPLVFWNNRSWITTEGKYDSRKKMYYPAVSAGSDQPDAAGEETQETAEAETAPAETAAEPAPIPAKEADQEYLNAVANLVENKILMCSGIMKLDYYGKIFGPDEVKGDPEAVWEMLKAELDARRAEQETAEVIQSEVIQTESIAVEEPLIPSYGW
jgi:lipoteichoic acid synthase